MLFMILIAVVLIGALTAVIMNSDDNKSDIDDETLALRLSEVQRYASELERAINFMTQSGIGESSIRFAHPNASSAYGDLASDTDKTDQTFHSSGGGASYREPPDGVNDGSDWEFYGGSDLPSVGSDRADLIAVLPNVTQQFCEKVNEMNGQAATLSDSGTDPATASTAGDCVYMGTTYGKFNDTTQFYASPNTVSEADFAQDTNASAARPAPQACVTCAIDSKHHFYHVIMAR